MALDVDFKLDADAQKLADEAAKSSTCIPIGRRGKLLVINTKIKFLVKILNRSKSSF